MHDEQLDYREKQLEQRVARLENRLSRGAWLPLWPSLVAILVALSFSGTIFALLSVSPLLGRVSEQPVLAAGFAALLLVAAVVTAFVVAATNRIAEEGERLHLVAADLAKRLSEPIARSSE
jgi:hypothetical protein